ncbi:MAG: hypothetical protein AAGC60_28970 [Acidobacteriota bacterium]
MIHRLEAARRLLWLWLPPLVFVLLMVVTLAVYVSFYSGRVDALEAVYERATGDLEALREDRRTLDTMLGRIGAQDDNVDALYRDYFGLESERFTAAARSLRGLARQAGLDPSSFGYAEASLDVEGLERRGIQFAVEGTYDQLRTFINLLELTDQFFILEDVALGGNDQQRNAKLQIRLGLSTIFAERSVMPPPRAADAAVPVDTVEVTVPEEGTMLEEGAVPDEDAESVAVDEEEVE